MYSAPVEITSPLQFSATDLRRASGLPAVSLHSTPVVFSKRSTAAWSGGATAPAE
jgi:hypothetical protein